MKFYKYLYFPKDIKEKSKDKIKKELRHCSPFLYIIFIDQNSDNLEIMNAAFLKIKYYRKRNLTIIGIARGKDEALELVQNIILECINSLGRLNIRDYLSKRIKNIDSEKEV